MKNETHKFDLLPEYSRWTCYLFGGEGGISWKPEKGKVPNAFWRFMQYICFGNKWIKGDK